MQTTFYSKRPRLKVEKQNTRIKFCWGGGWGVVLVSPFICFTLSVSSILFCISPISPAVTHNSISVQKGKFNYLAVEHPVPFQKQEDGVKKIIKNQKSPKQPQWHEKLEAIRKKLLETWAAPPHPSFFFLLLLRI